MTSQRIERHFPATATSATDAALELTIKPFIDRFVAKERHDKAIASFLPKQPRAHWGDLAHMTDNSRARPLEPATIAPWKAVRGVFLVEDQAFSMSLDEALAIYVPGDTVFVSYEATFAVIKQKTGQPLLLT
jgi:hypothetical protein